MQLHAAWGDPEGIKALVQTQQTATVTTLAQAEALGTEVAARLQAGGALVCKPD